MKKRFEKLSKSEQEKVEAKYHKMDPHEFDTIMERASVHRPNVKPRKTRIQRKGRLKPQASR